MITRAPDEHFELVVPQDDATTATLRAQAPWLSPSFVTDTFDLRVGFVRARHRHTGARGSWWTRGLASDDADRTTPAATATHRPSAGSPRRRRVSCGVRRRRRRHAHRRCGRQHPSDQERRGARVSRRVYVIAPEEIAALRAGRFPGLEAYQVLLDQGLVDEADGPVAGEVATEPAPGHSTGHRFVRIGPEGDDAVVVGHLFLHPAQVFAPEPRAGLDENIDLAAETRRKLLRRAADESTLVIGPLWASPGRARSSRPTNPVVGVWCRPANGRVARSSRTRTRGGRRGRTGR